MTHFDPFKTYILVGGCGGVGLELTHWMVKKGAKRIVLTSRSQTRTAYQEASLAVLAKTALQLPAFCCDVSVYSGDLIGEEGVRQMLQQVASKGAPIGGIFHLATQLNDTPMKGMTADKWQATVDSKATLGQHLDRLSREMLPSLDYFVCFSSISSGLGMIGQANYGYANAVLDRLCERRRADGLHGLSLQYGPIADVGLLQGEADSFEISTANVRMQRIRSCLDVLNRALQSDRAVLSSFVYLNRTHQNAVQDNQSRL